MVDKDRFLSTNPLDDVDSDWGYVTVRDNAHMFWWLFMHDTSYQPSFLAPQEDVPLIVWLQVIEHSKAAYEVFSFSSPIFLQFVLTIL